MKTWRDYITEKEIKQYICKKCDRYFTNPEGARIHVFEVHAIEIEMFGCEVCNEPSIKIIDGQKRCMNQKCLFYDETREGMGFV